MTWSAYHQFAIFVLVVLPNVVPGVGGAAAAAPPPPPETLIEMHILRPHLRLTEAEPSGSEAQ